MRKMVDAEEDHNDLGPYSADDVTEAGSHGPMQQGYSYFGTNLLEAILAQLPLSAFYQVIRNSPLLVLYK